MLGPIIECTAPHAGLEMRDGRYYSKAIVNQIFWTMTLAGWPVNDPHRKAGDKILKDNA